MKSSQISGIGGIVFGVLTIASLFVLAPPGGNYRVSDLNNFVASGHRTAAFVALYLATLAALGLIALLAGLRDLAVGDNTGLPVAMTTFWGAGVVAAAAAALGWAIGTSLPIAYAFGGSGFSVSPPQIFAVVQMGNALVLGVSGILLGLALILYFLFGRRGLPTWLQWVTLIAGIIALASPGFFPWFILPIWGIITGIWFLAAERTRAS